jgi:Tfp pilus assembly protein PilN
MKRFFVRITICIVALGVIYWHFAQIQQLEQRLETLESQQEALHGRLLEILYVMGKS